MVGARPVITIGTFDGVHAGHAALLRHARARAGGDRVVALVFDPHPRTVTDPSRTPPRLTTLEERTALLRAAGADEVRPLRPTPELISQAPAEFVAWVSATFSPRLVVEGDDFRFGKGRAGDPATLRELGRSAAPAFEVEIPPPVDVALSDGTLVRAASTITRWLLAHGRVRDAARVLGRPYALRGRVVAGDRLGRTLGFPTANLRADEAEATMIPGDGVYAGWAHVPGGAVRSAAVSIGARPTIGDGDRRVEVHVLGPDAGTHLTGLPAYGWVLRVELIASIREQMRFAGLDALREQIARDCARIARMLDAERDGITGPGLGGGARGGIMEGSRA